MSDGPRPLEDHITWFIRLSDAFGRFCYRILADVQIEGLERVPRGGGPLIVASNHASNADPPLIASYVTRALGRRIHWLGKQEALDWPIVGRAIAANAVFGIRRGAADLEAFKAAKRVLDEGHVLGVFPEGTRSPTGALQPAKEGIGVLALAADAPILPIGIGGTYRFWPRGQKLPHPRGRLTMRIGEPFRPDEVVAGLDRRAAKLRLTDEVMRRIASLLPPEQRGAYASGGAATPADSSAPAQPASATTPEGVSTDSVR